MARRTPLSSKRSPMRTPYGEVLDVIAANDHPNDPKVATAYTGYVFLNPGQNKFVEEFKLCSEDMWEDGH